MELLRFRLRLDPLSPFGTPPTSGTLFGQIAWTYRDRNGREALKAWFDRLPQEPFLISDLFPADHIAKPILAPGAALVAPDQRKRLKKRRFIPLAHWSRLRAGALAAALGEAMLREGGDPLWLAPRPVPHNRLDRRSGQTPAEGEGGFWVAEELWPEVHRSRGAIFADLYVRGALPAPEVADLLSAMGSDGFGRDASIGRGRFTVEGWSACPDLLAVPEGPGALRWLSLSQGVITPNMEEARWERFVLFGKVGKGMLAEGKRPWKLPIVLAASGATFRAAGEGPFGTWLTGVHQDDGTIGHNAFHLALPYREGPGQAVSEAA